MEHNSRTGEECQRLIRRNEAAGENQRDEERLREAKAWEIARPRRSSIGLNPHTAGELYGLAAGVAAAAAGAGAAGAGATAVGGGIGGAAAFNVRM